MNPEPTGRRSLAPAWLLPHRVTAPAPPIGYIDREALTSRCAPAQRRVTLLVAPAGFGKSTLLTASCREAAAHGVPIAWLSLDGDVESVGLDAYLAFAFETAGLDVAEALHGNAAPGPTPYLRTNALLRALRSLDEPFVLALDAMEVLQRPDSVALLNGLLRNAPGNLHFLMAGRALPVGFDGVQAARRDQVEVLGADDLRFSAQDIDRFFDRRLSARQLAAVVEESGGWPIALRTNQLTGPGSRAANGELGQDLIENWVEARFWEGFPADDRALVLDAAQFQWFDDSLLAEVLEQADALRRLLGLSRLTGLLQREQGGAARVYSLHSLLREYGERKLQRDAQQRHRDIHRRIGLALARRGETVAGMRHAAQGGDSHLAGRILIDAGGLTFWLREGPDQLVAADRFLTGEAVSSNARLAMARSVALGFVGKLAQARRLVARTAGAAPGGGLELDIDRCLARAMLVHGGGPSLDSPEFRAVIAEVRRFAEEPAAQPVVRGTMEHALCAFHTLRGDFDAAQRHGARALELVRGRSSYIEMATDFQLGQIDMARGFARQAARRYRTGLRVARSTFLRDARLAMLGQLLLQELNLERGKVRPGSLHGPTLEKVYRSGAQFASYAAASEIIVERRLDLDGLESAVSTLDELLEHARGLGLVAAERLLAALRVSLLADAGRVGDAERTWRAGRLPLTNDACLDLGGQSWRELEAITCARIRLLTAKGDRAAGRRLCEQAADVASRHGLQRARLRALALWIGLEEDAGDREAARERLLEYLALYAETGFSRPLARLGQVAEVALQRFLDGASEDDGMAAAARTLLSLAHVRPQPTARPLSGRQRQVLKRLGDQPDREIAAALGLTVNGVRYHIRSIFGALRVGSRAAAVNRARELGLLAPRHPDAG